MPLILGTNSIKDTGYDVANSLRFDGSSDYLNRNQGTQTNDTKYTFSAWVKRSGVLGSSSVNEVLLGSFTSFTDTGYIRFEDQNDNLQVYDKYGSTIDLNYQTNMKFRDPNAWYHIVVNVDGSRSANQRCKIYVNGSEVSCSNTTDTGGTLGMKTSTDMRVGAINNSTGASEYYFSGYMAEVYYIDGSGLDASNFGEFNSDSPTIWQPKAYEGSFGNNGFYLDFENASSLGADVSGNSNNFTVNNLTSIDQTTDTCTNNFCTLNPLVAATSRTDNQNYSEGNTIIIPNSTDNYGTTFSTIGVQGSGKWYWEAQIVWNGTSNNANFPRTIGFVTEDYAFNYSYLGQDQESWGMMFSDETPDQWFASHPDENNNEGGTMANGDTVNLALDLDNGYFYFGINGTYINSGNPTSGASGTGAVFTLTATDLSKFIIPAVTNATNTTYYKFNFGNPAYSISSGNSDANGLGNFENAVPSGYFSLCSSNLADFG